VRARRSLFKPGAAPDQAYRNLRDSERCLEWKDFCERLWQRYEPYADTHFLDEIQRQFHQRFWEMYLGVTFLERGYKLHRHNNAGPEFGIDIEGKRYWLDAIAPRGGDGPDAVPRVEYGRTEVSTVPQEQIILRIMSALAAKREKWKKDREAGLVSDRDGFMVAMNDRGIRWAWLGAEMPYVVKGLYGFGNLAVSIDPRTLEVVESKHLHRPTIAKASGTGISSQPFAAHECPEVSGMIYSSVDAANFPGVLGADFTVLHNREPNVPLPMGALHFYREYWIDGEHLMMKDWSSKTV
jgi:hypothetical protein